MFELLAEAGASGFDWVGAATFVTAVGGIIVALLQFLGKKDAAAKAKQATAALGATIRGVEVAAREGDFTDLTKQLKEQTGLELTPQQLRLIASGATKAVKGSIKATSMEHSVADYLAAIVETRTQRLELTPEQKKKLAEEADAE
ncbi:hypothetical protein LCGC14_0274100 [marine sediment metagenome]|uniref:Uncharacterized protein n=2 Tax=root TaxID=1 RepID=A0A9C9TG28_9HYPH|nr:hypothetical protein [Aurantimonas coralicida]